MMLGRLLETCIMDCREAEIRCFNVALDLH